MSQNILVKLNAANQLLSDCRTIQEAKNIRDIAEAARTYAKQANLGQLALDYALQIKFKAERLLGTMLAASPKNIGGNPKLTPSKNEGVAPTLSEIGIDYKLSSKAQFLASLPEEIFEEIKLGIITVEEVRKNLNRKRRVKDIQDISKNNSELKTDKKYPVILCDPPWEYDYSVSQNREIDNHYPTMKLQDITELPVEQLALEHAVLFLWVTSPKLVEGIEILHQWGFEYRTCMVWVKDKIGMGYYARQRHELLLIGSRGEMPCPEPANRPDSVIEAPRTQHSSKPPIIYDILDKMYPEFEKIELFRRGTLDRKNWSAWGNQA